MIQTTYVSLDRGVPAILYKSGKTTNKSKYGIIVMHSDADYLGHSAGPKLSERGYTVLCANVAQSDSNMETKILNLKTSVKYLHAYPGIEKVILLGHSGGATLMTAYQTIAENGVKSVQDKMVKISNAVDNLPAADGVMLLDANWGNGPMMLFSLDPAVNQEGKGVNLNPEYDIFNIKNGYSKDGAKYNEEFKKNYFKAQGNRFNSLIKQAQDTIIKLDKGQGNFIDDEPLLIVGGDQKMFNNKLYPQDISLLSHTKEKWPLLHADGSVTTEIIHSVRTPFLNPSNTTSYNGLYITTVRNLLSKNSIRVTPDYKITEDGVYGIDWSSNITTPIGNIQGIHVPLLLMGMTGSWEYLAAEEIYKNANNTNDKTLTFVEGATHTFETNKSAEKYPGQYGDTVKILYDYVDKWISNDNRFIK